MQSEEEKLELTYSATLNSLQTCPQSINTNNGSNLIDQTLDFSRLRTLGSEL